MTPNTIITVILCIISQVYTQQAPGIRGSEPEYPLSAYPLSLLTINEYDNNTCVLYWLNDIRKSNQPPSKSLNFINTLLLIISGVETNPGPIKYPCGVFSKACRWNQKALACDDCDQWFHTACMGVSNSAYDNLANTSVSWYCTNCNRPNHSTLPYDLSSSVANRFSSLQPDSFNSTISSIGSPTATSSPRRVRNKPQSKVKQGLRTLIINFQSVKNKVHVPQLDILLESTSPDIIIGTETWTNNTMHSSEFYPDNYTIYRRNRGTKIMAA